MKRARIITAGALSSLMLAMAMPSAWALSVSPPRTDIQLEPGAVGKVILTVTNPNPEARAIELSSKPWFKYPDNQSIVVADWLKLPSKTNFVLKSGKSREVTIRVECPKQAVGELMGMVSFSSVPEADGGMITSMVSTPIYLRVMGTEINTGTLLAIGAGTKQGVFLIGVQIKATGNVRLRPVGTVQMIRSDGQVYADYVVPEASPIFPGVTQDVAAQGSSNAPPPGGYTLKAALKSGSLELTGEQRIVVKSNGEVTLEK